MVEYIQTYMGKKFYPLAPVIADIDIVDIAHALSLICRFTGHVSHFYSVAQHSVHVSEHCAPPDALWGLLHDATEAYIADVSSPVKSMTMMDGYRVAEARLMDAICERYGLDGDMPDSVLLTDRQMLNTEGQILMSPDFVAYPDLGTVPLCFSTWGSAFAEQRFLARFYALYGQAHVAPVSHSVFAP